MKLSASVQFSSVVQLLSRVRLFATPRIEACQASLSITNSWSLPKLMSIELVMPSSHLILCRPFLLLPPIPPSIRVFSNESTLRMRHSSLQLWSLSCSPLHFSFFDFSVGDLNRYFSKDKQTANRHMKKMFNFANY